MLVRSGSVDVVVVSTPLRRSCPRPNRRRDGEPQMGLQARLMSQALSKTHRQYQALEYAGRFSSIRSHEIGVMFGNPETTTAAMRSSSMLPCGSTFAAPAPSSQVRK